ATFAAGQQAAVADGSANILDFADLVRDEVGRLKLGQAQIFLRARELVAHRARKRPFLISGLLVWLCQRISGGLGAQPRLFLEREQRTQNESPPKPQSCWRTIHFLSVPGGGKIGGRSCDFSFFCASI